MRSLLLAIAAIVAGCSPLSVDYTGDYLAGLSIVCGVAAVQSPQAPTPSPTPGGECQSCSGLGWLGDGRPRADCPDCDRNQDGDLDDPLPSTSAAASAAPGTEDGPKHQAQGMVAVPPAAPAHDEPAAVLASPWRSPLLPAKFPAVVLFGDEAWALELYATVPESVRKLYAWSNEPGERAVVLYRNDEGEWVDPAGLVKALEAIE